MIVCVFADSIDFPLLFSMNFVDLYNVIQGHFYWILTLNLL